MTVDLHSASDDELPGVVAGLAAAERYASLIANSTHDRDIEAVIEEARQPYHALNDAYVLYLSRSTKGKLNGTPGYENQSGRWREAEREMFGFVRALAALLRARYASPNGHLPIEEAQKLIANRLGPLCHGWTYDDTGDIYHHPNDPCPVHG